MCKFFSKNKTSILIGAFILIAVVVGVFVMRAPAPVVVPEEEKPNVMPSNESPVSAPTEAASQSEGPSEEGPEEFDPMESPEQRVVEEWERLGIIPEGSDNKPADPVTPQAAPAPQASSLPNPDAMAPQGLQSDDESGQQLSGQTVVPTHFETKDVVINPDFVKVALKFDNDEGPTIPQDPNDPTSEGESKHGKHKGPKVMGVKSIPIIRMGETVEEHNGFKVITPWNS